MKVRQAKFIIIRSVTTGVVLAEVWTHAHWSVGLSLTCIWIGFEVLGLWVSEVNSKMATQDREGEHGQ